MTTTELPSILPSAVTTSPVAGAPGTGAPTAPQLAPLTPARKAWVENVTILLAHKTLILSATAIVTIATGIYAFTQMPNMYRSSAVILPARHSGGSGLDAVTSGISSTLKDIGLGKLKSGEESYSPLSLMQSRSLQEVLIKKYDFQREYDAKTMDEALKEFSTHLDGDLTEEGNFVVSFEDSNRVRAAEVANSVVDGINKVNSRLAQDEATHNLTYIEQRFQKNVSSLDSAEKQLGDFQRKFGVFSVTDQAKVEMTALAELEQQKYMTEIALQNAIQQFGSNSSEVTTYRTALSQLTGKLSQLQSGMDLKASSFVPTSVMPDVALQYLRLMREVEIQSKLKAFLLPSYEQAKMDEDRNLLGFVTLDRAVPAMKKIGPKRSLILLGTMIGAFAVMSILVLTRVALRRATDSYRRDKQYLTFATEKV